MPIFLKGTYMKTHLLTWGMSLTAVALLAACGQSQNTSSQASSVASSSMESSLSTESSLEESSLPEESSLEESSPEASGEETSTSPSELTAVYFKQADWWGDDGAWSGIYLWGDDSKNADWPGQPMENLGDGIWKFAFPEEMDYTNLIFTRIGPDGLTDYGAKTIDLAIADIDPETPLYDISGVTTPIWGDPGVSGIWTAYEAE